MDVVVFYIAMRCMRAAYFYIIWQQQSVFKSNTLLYLLAQKISHYYLHREKISHFSFQAKIGKEINWKWKWKWTTTMEIDNGNGNPKKFKMHVVLGSSGKEGWAQVGWRFEWLKPATCLQQLPKRRR